MPENEDDHNRQTIEVKPITENPVILDKVQYHYISYAQVAISTVDFRIAFGDRIPPDGNRVNPVVGVTMSHELAKALLDLLVRQVPGIDLLKEQKDRQVSQNADTHKL